MPAYIEFDKNQSNLTPTSSADSNIILAISASNDVYVKDHNGNVYLVGAAKPLNEVLQSDNNAYTNINMRSGSSLVMDTVYNGGLVFSNFDNGNSITVRSQDPTELDTVLYIPNASGTLVATVNGVGPDEFGNVVIDTGSFTGSFSGSFTGAFIGTATSASYVQLQQGPGIVINGLAISSSVRTVNGVSPVNGNIAVSFGATLTGTSASLAAYPTTSLADATVWIVSGDSTPANNGDTYIFNSGSQTWFPIAPLDQAAGDARYLQLSGGTMQGSINMGGFDTVNAGQYFGTASVAITASYALNAAASAAPNLQQVTDQGNTTTSSIQVGTSLFIQDTGSGATGEIEVYTNGLSDNRYYSLPDNSGTVVLSVNSNSADSGGNVTVNSVPSASFAATASFVQNINTSRIATGSVTASVSPNQSIFTLTSGSTTVLQVTGSTLSFPNNNVNQIQFPDSLIFTGANTPFRLRSTWGLIYDPITLNKDYAQGISSLALSSFYGTLTLNTNGTAVFNAGFDSTPDLFTIQKQYAGPSRNLNGASETLLYINNKVGGFPTFGNISRGVYVDLLITASGFNDYRAIETTVGNVTLNTISGSTLIGTVTGSGHKLYVSGSGPSGSLNVNNALFVSGSQTRVSGSFVVQTDSTEFQVLSTGTKIGNSSTDVHQITGSISASGHLTLNAVGTGPSKLSWISFQDVPWSIQTPAFTNRLAVYAPQYSIAPYNSAPVPLIDLSDYNDTTAPTLTFYGSFLGSGRPGGWIVNPSSSRPPYSSSFAVRQFSTHPLVFGTFDTNNNRLSWVKTNGDGYFLGNLGIGIESSIYKLHVSGAGNFTNGLTVTGSLIVPLGFTGSLQGTSSLAFDLVNPQRYINTGSVNGSQTITGSLTVTQNLEVLGSASISYLTASQTVINQNAIIVFGSGSALPNASYTAADTSSQFGSSSLTFNLPNQQWYIDKPLSGSFIGEFNGIVAGYLPISSTGSMLSPYALTSALTSYVLNSATSSMTVLSSSYALTASYALNSQTVDTSGLLTTSSFNSYTGSNASQFAGTSSYALTASYALNSQAVDVSGYTTTSSFNNFTSSVVTTSSFNSYTASNAPIVIEGKIGGTIYIQGVATVTGLTDGSNGVTSSAFVNRIVEVHRNGYLQPGFDLGDASSFVSKSLSSNIIDIYNGPLATDEWIKIKCL